MKKYIVTLMGALALAACGQDRCAESDNPAQCRQWVDSGGDVNDYLLGGMAGYMIASSMQNGQRVQYIQRDPNYSGPTRNLRAQIRGKDAQLKAAEVKIAKQRKEIARQKREAAKQKATAKQQRSSYRSSNRSSRPSFRPSFRPGRGR